ncbi:sigma-54 interaction domain-containing protein [Mangrovitalea sediminis]|uniref:sigma-54 interaction domain-containing protein n=1 Tax=Mangrovitalea sediminis TaxID=1982043 RepID=UPI0018E9D8CB|nr:sigma 54-interacting transcriptional regulator [Mangrovitalea sediminis]
MTDLNSPPKGVRESAVKMLAESFGTFYEYAIAIDTAHKVTWISDGYQRFLGLDRSPIGDPITRHIPNSYMPRVVDTGKPVFLDLLYVQEQWVIVSALPLQNETGSIVGAFGFVAMADNSGLGKLANKYNKLQQELKSVSSQLDQERRSKYRLSHIVGRSRELQAIKQRLRQVARFDISVLLTGETGTGKELFAHAIHQLSNRSHKPFVSLNVSAIPDNLVEAEFFGVAPGAFTGAKKEGREGKLALARGGTLFLDEIGDMPAEVQSKLLRVLQDQEFEAVGSDKVQKANVRIVAATSRDLQKMIREGEFRSDLFYRLNGMPLHLPPLRERLEDIDLIAERILDDITSALHLQLYFLTPDALDVLRKHNWPGNIRELRNVLERAVILSQNNPEIGSELISELLAQEHGVIPGNDDERTQPDAKYASESLTITPLQEQMASAERAALKQALGKTNGNRKKAAELLGISRASLYEKMGRLKL